MKDNPKKVILKHKGTRLRQIKNEKLENFGRICQDVPSITKLLKVTVYLQGCLARKRCSACSLSCRYLNPYIKLKLMELAIKLYQEF